MKANRPQSWIRFGINAEKPILTSCVDYYDGLAIPAHVFALYRNSLGQSLVEWNKPYFIDPMTYVFLSNRAIVRKNGGPRLRKSYEKLCEYDKRAEYYLGLDDLDPNALSNTERTDFADTMARLVVQVQLDGIAVSGPQKRVKSLQRIQKHMSGGKDQKFPAPAFLVSPYFFFENVGDSTYELWKKSVKAFEKKVSKKNTDLPIYKAVCTGQETLSTPQDISVLLSDLEGSDGVLLWISDFENSADNPNLLEGFGNLVKGIKESSAKVVSLYGGYLTALYYHFGLDSLSFGLSYGDNKEVGSYATGGGAPSRYYDPNLHTFITANNAVLYYGKSLQNAKRFSCDCRICRDTKQALQQESQESKVLQHLEGIFEFKSKAKVSADWSDMRKHFLFVREKELENIGTKSLSDLGKEATDNMSDLGSSEVLDFETLEMTEQLASIGP